MYKENDEMERVRKSLGKTLAEAIFGKEEWDEEQAEEEEGLNLEQQMTEILIHKHVREGNINEAENLLFAELEENPTKKNLTFALSFYDQVAQFDEETLERFQYSKEEIEDGLLFIRQLYTREYAEKIAEIEGAES